MQSSRGRRSRRPPSGETAEEAGLTVQAVKVLGECVHPNTGRLMGLVACDVICGEAYVTDAEKLADIVWATPDKFADYVPYGFAPVVQDYLTATLA